MRRPQISAAFLEKKFPYALCNLTFTNKSLVKGQKKNVSHKRFFILHYFLLKKFTAKTVDEDPVGCQRWISRKEILTAKILRTKNEKSTWACLHGGGGPQVGELTRFSG